MGEIYTPKEGDISVTKMRSLESRSAEEGIADVLETPSPFEGIPDEDIENFVELGMEKIVDPDALRQTQTGGSENDEEDAQSVQEKAA